MRTYWLPEEIYREGADCILVMIGSTVHVYFNGQKYKEINITSAINLTGDCQVNINDTGGVMTSCLFELYQMALPGGISDIEPFLPLITQKPELPLGAVIEVTPKINFPIRSDLVGASEDTIANQGDGGGNGLVLDAIRSISCKVAFTGHESL